MIVKIKSLFLCITLLVVIGCNSNKISEGSYFGGKIINPKSDHVVLYSMDRVIDTFFLDKNNRFLKKLDKLNEGLYYFIHGIENQHIYLEPKDSLILRINSWDFDESLVYTGRGAERNNILIDCFLEDEKDKVTFYEYYKLNPENFKYKLDSIISKKLITYQNYLESHPEETDGFKEVLKVALTYPVFARAEKYPLLNARYSDTNEYPILSDNFYNYRNNIDITKDSLMYYRPYSQYIRNYLYNQTYALGHQPTKNRYATNFTVDLLKTIGETLKSESSRNAFLKQTVISHFYNNSSCKIDNEPFNEFFKLSTNKHDLLVVKNLLNDTRAVSRNKQIPNFKVTDYLNNKSDIKKLIKGENTFIFFWNDTYVSQSYLTSRINYLKNSYPNIHFILIKIDGKKSDRIETLDIKNQYYLDTQSEAHQFLTSKMPRSILINNDGKVVNGYASISSYNVKKYLEDLNNRK